MVTTENNVEETIVAIMSSEQMLVRSPFYCNSDFILKLRDYLMTVLCEYMTKSK